MKNGTKVFVTVPWAGLVLTTVADGIVFLAALWAEVLVNCLVFIHFFLHLFWLVWDPWKQGKDLHSTKHRCQEILAS